MALLDDERIAAGLWIASGLGVLALMVLLSAVVTPFALGAVLAYLLVPGVDWLQRRGLARTGGALIMIVLAILVLLGLALILVPILQRELRAFQDQWPDLFKRLNEQAAPWLHEHFGWSIRFDARGLTELLTSHVGEPTSELANSVIQRLRAGGAVLLTTGVLLILVPVVLFYLLVDWHEFMRRCEAAVPRRWHAQLASMMREIDLVLSQLLRGQLSVMVALAVYYGAALSALGLQAGLAIGALTGMLLFIPYVGFGIGLALALIAAALQFEGWYGVAMVTGIYAVGKVIEDFFLTPRLVGGRLGMHPLAVIFALLAFGELFGFLGIVVALPSCAILLVALRRLKQAYFASAFYGRE